MATNLVVSDGGDPVDSLFEEEEELERIVPRKGGAKTPSEGRIPPSLDRTRERRDRVPSSFVPRRSPDLGATTFPLTPSIGPRSGSLGPEAGRSPSRLRSDFEIDESRRALGTGRH